MLEIFRVAMRDQPYCLPAPSEFSNFFIQTRRHSLTGALVRQLEKFGHSDEQFVAAAREHFKIEFIQYAQYQALLADIHRALQSHRGEILLLKGAALNVAFYPPGFRGVSDLDLFALDNNCEILQRVLLELGFKNSTNGHAFRHPDGRFIEVHGPSLGRAEDCIGLGGARLWENAIPDPGFPSFRQLAPADQLAYLSVHSLKHSYERLIWLWDLWHAFQQVSGDADLGKGAAAYAVSCAGFLLEDLAGQKVWPDSGLSETDKKLLKSMIVSHRQPLGQFMLCWHQPSWRGRLNYLRRALLPNQEPTFRSFINRLLRIGLQSVRYLVGYRRGKHEPQGEGS